MKYLIDYTQAAQTKLFNDCGAFFAFSNKQFEDAQKVGSSYVSYGVGLFCEKQHLKKLSDGLESIQQAGINMDIEDNGKEAIIGRELANYEVQTLADTKEVVEVLAPYGITEHEVQFAHLARPPNRVFEEYF